MAAAHRQVDGLAGEFVAFDPDHLGARDHDLAGRGVAEFEDRLDHPAFLGGDHATLLSQVDDLAQLDLRGERPVLNPRPGVTALPSTTRSRLIGINNHEIACSGSTVVNAME